jgi:hypothetical protein
MNKLGHSSSWWWHWNRNFMIMKKRGRLGSAQYSFQQLLHVEVIQGQLWKGARTRCFVGLAPTPAVELSRWGRRLGSWYWCNCSWTPIISSCRILHHRLSQLQLFHCFLRVGVLVRIKKETSIFNIEVQNWTYIEFHKSIILNLKNNLLSLKTYPIS